MEMEKRWEEMETDCLVSIFERVGIQELLVTVPFVCKSWYEASLHPKCWKALDLVSLNFGLFVDRFILNYRIEKFSYKGFLKLAVTRSHRTVVEILLPTVCQLDGLIYVSNECPSLKMLGLPLVLLQNPSIVVTQFWNEEMKNHIAGLVSKWKGLECLWIQGRQFYFKEILLEISLHCKNFARLKKSGCMDNEEVSAIVSYLPKLKYLNVTSGFMSRENLNIILEGCRELEELILKDCCGFEVDEEIIKMTSHIKSFQYEDLRLKTEEHNYNFRPYLEHNDLRLEADECCSNLDGLQLYTESSKSVEPDEYNYQN